MDGGRRIEAHTDAGTVSLLLQVLPPVEQPPVPASVVRRFDPSEWVGLDGRKADVVWFR